MASISYWFLSPSVMLAMLGKLRGWDRTVPTPAIDWKKVTVDLLIPAKNEEKAIALALSSIFQQDFPFRSVVVFDDGSTDQTSSVVRRYRELTGRDIQLVTRSKSIGKTPALREFCEQTDADAVVVLDGDTVLVSRNYLSRTIEELFKNAGVAATCGEVMPLTWRRRETIAKADKALQIIQTEVPSSLEKPGFWGRLLTNLTIFYRAPMYILLQRTLYDGHAKLVGAQLNPVGCAVAYKASRLRECFAYARHRVGDNLTTSEDIYIGHFFNWKGYRNVQVIDVHCESTEPPVNRLPRQLFLWSSAFLQSNYYFADLSLSPFRQLKRSFSGTSQAGKLVIGNPGVETSSAVPPGEKASTVAGTREDRVIREQYRAAWGEGVAKKQGRIIGGLELVCLLEKLSYPLFLVYFAFYDRELLFLTIAAETLFCTALILITADRGARLKYAAMVIPAMPIRLMSVLVDMFAAVRFAADLARGNRSWRK